MYYNVSTGVWYITMLVQVCGILQCQYRGVVYYNVSTGVWYITMLVQVCGILQCQYRGVAYYNVSTGVWYITMLVQGCGIFVYNNLKEQYLAGQYKLTYLHGKGRHFVPVLIPLDCVHVIGILIGHQRDNGIVTDNQFVFANRGMCVQT